MAYDHENCTTVHSPRPAPPSGQDTLFEVGNCDLNGAHNAGGEPIIAKAGSRITIPRSLAERWQAHGLGSIIEGESET